MNAEFDEFDAVFDRDFLLSNQTYALLTSLAADSPVDVADLLPADFATLADSNASESLDFDMPMPASATSASTTTVVSETTEPHTGVVMAPPPAAEVLPNALQPDDADDYALQLQLFNASGECPALPEAWDKKARNRFAKLFEMRAAGQRLLMFRPKFFVWARTQAKQSRDVTDVVYCFACDNATGYSMSMLHDTAQCDRHVRSHLGAAPSRAPTPSAPLPLIARLPLGQLDSATLLAVGEQALTVENAAEFVAALQARPFDGAEPALRARLAARAADLLGSATRGRKRRTSESQLSPKQQHLASTTAAQQRQQQQQAIVAATLATMQQIGRVFDEATCRTQISFYLKHFGVGSHDSVRDRCALFDSSFLRVPQCAPFLSGCVANLSYASQGATEHRRSALLRSFAGQRHPPTEWLVRGATWAQQCRAVEPTLASATANHVNALRKVELEFFYRIFDVLVREFARANACDVTPLKLMTRHEIREHRCFAFVRQAIAEQSDLSTFERWLREALQLCLPLDLFAALYAFGDDWYSERHYIALVDSSATFAEAREAEFAAALRRRTDSGGRQIGDRMNKWFEWMLAFVSDEQAALFDVFLTPLFWMRINAVQEQLHYVDIRAAPPFRFVPCGDEHEPFVRVALATTTATTVNANIGEQ
jgi:hypothetical protein